jgi:hypothetical protein
VSQYDTVLRMYAESGLRTVEDWITLGRDIQDGAKPRLDAPYQGGRLPLFRRDQTHLRSPSQGKHH